MGRFGGSDNKFTVTQRKPHYLFPRNVLAGPYAPGAPDAKIRIEKEKRRFANGKVPGNVLRNVVFDLYIFTHPLEFAVVKFRAAPCVFYHALGARSPVATGPFGAGQAGMGMQCNDPCQAFFSFFPDARCIRSNNHPFLCQGGACLTITSSRNFHDAEIASMVFCIIGAARLDEFAAPVDSAVCLGPRPGRNIRMVTKARNVDPHFICRLDN